MISDELPTGSIGQDEATALLVGCPEELTKRDFLAPSSVAYKKSEYIDV